MDRRYKIKNGLKKAGCQVRLCSGDWFSMPYYAVIQHNHRKTKSNFADSHTEIGFVDRDYYTYIGPFDHDITAVSDAVLHTDNEDYVFIKKEAVRVNDETIYYFGILKKKQEAEYDKQS